MVWRKTDRFATCASSSRFHACSQMVMIPAFDVVMTFYCRSSCSTIFCHDLLTWLLRNLVNSYLTPLLLVSRTILLFDELNRRTQAANKGANFSNTNILLNRLPVTIVSPSALSPIVSRSLQTCLAFIDCRFFVSLMTDINAKTLFYGGITYMCKKCDACKFMSISIIYKRLIQYLQA